MIVLDIETGGLDPSINPILSIGAVNYDNSVEFYTECYVPDVLTGSRWILDNKALEVNGFNLATILNQDNPTISQAYKAFVEWALPFGEEDGKVLLAGQQIGSFDVLFLHEASGGKREFEKYFSKRHVDLHSVAFATFGKSLSLDGILNELGLASEPKPHNALTGAKLEAEAFRRLLKGRCGCRATYRKD